MQLVAKTLHLFASVSNRCEVMEETRYTHASPNKPFFLLSAICFQLEMNEMAV